MPHALFAVAVMLLTIFPAFDSVHNDELKHQLSSLPGWRAAYVELLIWIGITFL